MKTFKKFIPALIILTAALAIFVQNGFFPQKYGTLVAENSKYRIWKTEEGTWLLTMYHFPKFSEDRQEGGPHQLCGGAASAHPDGGLLLVAAIGNPEENGVA